jgi:hypothetical protein
MIEVLSYPRARDLSQFVSIGEGRRRGEAAKFAKDRTLGPPRLWDEAIHSALYFFRRSDQKQHSALQARQAAGLNGRICWAFRRPRDLLRTALAARRPEMAYVPGGGDVSPWAPGMQLAVAAGARVAASKM